MKLKVERTFLGSEYTVGHMYIDGEYFCDTMEDTCRGLKSTMNESEIKEIKVKSKTAIPTGTYEVTLNVVSPKYSSSSFMKQYANGGRVPRLLNVPGFDGILIHTGNTAADTDGCLLVGENKVKGQVINSRDTFKKLYPKLQAATDGITIEIVEKD